MTRPGNQHCANCIGTLSFPIASIDSGDAVNEGRIGLSAHIGVRNVHRKSVTSYTPLQQVSLSLTLTTSLP